MSWLFFFYPVVFMYFFNYTFCDAPESWQFGLQDPASPAAEEMYLFHNYLVYIIMVISVFVFWMLFSCIYLFNNQKNLMVEKFTHASWLEFWWTVIPAIILLFIAVPSFNLLYSLDEIIAPGITLKIIGHQWYWSYQFTEFTYLNKKHSFDSYMIPTNELTTGAFRLLEVDNRVVLPYKTHIRLLVTSADVLHSWAVPSFGIKVDACPGSLSQASLYIKRKGTFYGQCSEMCGVNHGFMPIVVKVVSKQIYLNWLASK